MTNGSFRMFLPAYSSQPLTPPRIHTCFDDFISLHCLRTLCRSNDTASIHLLGIFAGHQHIFLHLSMHFVHYRLFLHSLFLQKIDISISFLCNYGVKNYSLLFTFLIQLISVYGHGCQNFLPIPSFLLFLYNYFLNYYYLMTIQESRVIFSVFLYLKKSHFILKNLKICC